MKIKITKDVAPYIYVGDIVDYPDGDAKSLIKNGYAESLEKAPVVNKPVKQNKPKHTIKAK